MPCGAILTLDPQTDLAVREMWQLIEIAGLPSMMLQYDYPPHLTLAVCEDMDLDGLIAHLPSFIAAFPPLQVDFPGVGVFSNIDPVVYLTVSRSPDLTSLHAAFWDLIGAYSSNLSQYYHPRAWVPHITLDQGMPLSLAGSIIDVLLRSPRPAAGLLFDIHLVDFDAGLQKNYSARLGSLLS
ncbi:MAG: 2'-5' RNA ligase family protein [Anaerolineaceae bacterium]|nr:2'-5' RNA ligase family protein [Anaerolineaceae bacterium]